MGYDIDQVTATLATDIMSFFVSIITVVVSFTMMVIISIYLSSIFFITVPITILITRYLSKRIRRKLRARNEQLGILNGFSEEMISGYQTIQAYVQEDSIYNLFEKTNLDTRDKMYEAGKNFTIVGPTVNFINNLSMSLVGVIGAIIYVFDLITIGGFGSFMLYSRRFSGPINQMSNLVADIQSALAAAERVFYVLDQPSEKEDRSEEHTSELQSRPHL